MKNIDNLLSKELPFTTISDFAELSELLVKGYEHLSLELVDIHTTVYLLQMVNQKSDKPLALVLLLLFSALNDGHLCLKLKEAQTLLKDLDNTGTAIDDFLENVESGHYDSILTKSDQIQNLPLVMQNYSDGEHLYFQKYFLKEKALQNALEKLVENDQTKIDENALDLIVERLYDSKSVIGSKANQPIVKDYYQEQAIRLCLQKRFCIVSGGPGTGKTSLLSNILRGLVFNGISAKRIKLAAPTGRAAQRITDSLQSNLNSISDLSQAEEALLQLNGETIHKLLGSSPWQEFKHNEHYPVDCDVLVLDEVSMVDLLLMEALFRAMPNHCKIILIGDKDQLPAVKAGAVFAELIPDSEDEDSLFKDNLVVLKTSYRAGSGINKVATDVNSGVYPKDLVEIKEINNQQLTSDICYFVNAQSESVNSVFWFWISHCFCGEYLGLLKSLNSVSDSTGLQKLKELQESSRVLCSTRKGEFGCDGINSQFHFWLRQNHLSSSGDFCHGEWVMMRENDYSRSLFNGDCGIVLLLDGEWKVCFFKNEGIRFFGLEVLRVKLISAFAMTVHKSQGSEYKDVLVVLPPRADHRMNSREILYTALTRAKRTALLMASKPVLTKCIKTTSRRHSGLFNDLSL